MSFRATTSKCEPLFVGVAGGSASGKSTVVGELARRLGDGVAAVIAHDRYYRDRSGECAPETINFDHPQALETERLVADLLRLANGLFIDAPAYDYASHARLPRLDRIHPKPVVFVEGLFVLAEPDIRERMDVRVFVDTPLDARFQRRLSRDVAARGRTEAFARRQFEETVRPMHDAFVEPSRRYAHLIVPDGGFNVPALERVLESIQHALRQRRR